MAAQYPSSTREEKNEKEPSFDSSGSFSIKLGGTAQSGEPQTSGGWCLTSPGVIAVGEECIFKKLERAS
ncbi:hypothetical protein GWI33_000461 [Rhynchophorus ferrugineus]|uniref:Uncharacterized protein n=1 Tax=Rhynchophorus ferrugineus TaxID=354439 RepID=A0A834HR10_RHYFE|nr:hypothetical protein GWI33_000462 [Rhynchophorus ferrugineus]KAF7264216.1 hypothetical protein GWI33_000461 [Rhynchophorus ferrugineus]